MANANSVSKLKELLFQQESATLVDLEQRIARVAEAEQQARSQIAENLRQLEAIREIGAESRTLQDKLERRFTELNARTGTPEALRSSVAQVIDDVIVEARETKQDDLSRALAPMLVKTIKSELKNNQAEMVEALYPITGQLVKSYVASAMRDLSKRMNRGLQSNSFMLRLRSLSSGYSLAELRLAETQQLEVEELFLIRRGSGELLQRFPASLQSRSNSDIHMSGVLAAINDFAANAFQSDGGHLRSFDVDDFTLFLRASPVYLLAAKCRGVAAPGVDGLIDDQFLAAVGRLHEAENAGVDQTGSTRVLADLKTRLEGRIADRHEELSTAGLPFNPLRALAGMAILALVAGGGWYAWTTWEVEQTRTAARNVIGATEAMHGYPVNLEVGPRGQSVAVSGLAPNDSARSQLMTRLATELPGIVIADRGLAALPAQGPDLMPTIASVRKDLGGLESTIKRDLAAVEAQTLRAAALRSLDRAQRRLEDALPDLGVLSTLQGGQHRGLVTTVQKAVDAALSNIATQAGALHNRAADPALDTRTREALTASVGQLRKVALELAGMIGQRPVPEVPLPASQRSRGDLLEVTEAAALAAERVATISAAAVQAASIRVPEPPKLVPPNARERLQDYATRNAIFFSNSEDYRDGNRAAAIIAEMARLAREAGVLVRVVGYTDERGGQARNTPLAQSRAEKVAQELIARGVPRNRIAAVGRPTGPDLSFSTGPDSANRRVEFEIGFEGEPVSGP